MSREIIQIRKHNVFNAVKSEIHFPSKCVPKLFKPNGGFWYENVPQGQVNAAFG